MYLIISLKVEPRDFSDRTDDLEAVLIDFPDLLQLALKFWNLIGHGREESESLTLAVEAFLSKYRERRIVNYPHLQSMTNLIVESIRKFHDDLDLQLTPLLKEFPEGTSLSLSRFLSTDILVRVDIGNA